LTDQNLLVFYFRGNRGWVYSEWREFMDSVETIYIVSLKNEMNSKRRKCYLAGITCFILLWAVGSWALWSDIPFKPGALSVPIGILSWPGHQVCLAISGQGMGANANCPATTWSFMVFITQAAITWALLMPCVLAPRKKWFWAVWQGVILVLLFVGFWYWGNG
jgi:hypothetical protein